jgi:hypothetical protein
VDREPVAGDRRAGAALSSDRRALARAVAYFALTRIAVFLVGACAIRFLPVGLQEGTERYLPQGLSVGAWLRWDAWWYVSIVERGYWFDPQGQSSVAFFPLFPLVIGGLTALVGNPVIAGLIVANAAALAAVAALWLWVRAEAGPEAADRAVRWLAVFPFSFFFHTIYAEALFFLLVALSLLADRRGQWPLAGLWGGLAAATRPMGVLLLPAYGWRCWRAWRAGQRPGAGELAGLALIPAGLGAYAGYLALRFGDPLVFLRAHAAGWGVHAGWDLTGYERGFVRLLHRGPRVQTFAQLVDLLGVVLPLVFAGLVFIAARRLGSVAGLYAALALAVGVLFAPESVGRELLAVVPAFAALGLLDRGGSTGEALRMVSLGCLFVLAFAFVTAHFVG